MSLLWLRFDGPVLCRLPIPTREVDELHLCIDPPTYSITYCCEAIGVAKDTYLWTRSWSVYDFDSLRLDPQISRLHVRAISTFLGEIAVEFCGHRRAYWCPFFVYAH